MKKFLIYLCIISVTFAICIFLFTRTNILNGIYNCIQSISINISSTQVEEYNKNFKINDLGIIENNTFYYDKLNLDQKKIYTSVANSVKKLEKEAVVKFDKGFDMSYISEDVKEAMESFFNDHPEIFYLNTDYQILTNSSAFGNSVKIFLGYSVENLEELQEKISIIKSGIQEIIKDINVDDTIYQKELKIHDNIAKNIEYYDYDNITTIPAMYHTAYSGITEKKAVCDGFTKLFQLALNEIKINSILVTGKLDSDPHAWNMVQLDGKWYNVDLTSDKTIKDKEGIVIHSYFNVTNDSIMKTHVFDTLDILPIADSEEYNYYVKENKVIKSVDNFVTKFESILLDNKDNSLLELRIDESISSVPEKIVRRLSQRDHEEYIDEEKSTIQYYKISDTYILMKN